MTRRSVRPFQSKRVGIAPCLGATAAQDLSIHGLNGGTGCHVEVCLIGFGTIAGAEVAALDDIVKMASITSGNPVGDVALLPCTTSNRAKHGSTSLCYDPGRVCDEQDDNCEGTIDDEPFECNGLGSSAEVCEGVDNGCTGIADDGVVCGVPSPANCAGRVTCVLQPVSMPGGGVATGAQRNTCNSNLGNRGLYEAAA